VHEFACLINGTYRAHMMDPSKLKVVELRAALGERGLDTKGNKPVLVERLRRALEEEAQECKRASSSASLVFVPISITLLISLS